MSLRYGSFEAEDGYAICIPAIFTTEIGMFEKIEKLVSLENMFEWKGHSKILSPMADITWILPFCILQKRKIMLEFDRANIVVIAMKPIYTALYNQVQIYSDAYAESVKIRKQRLDVVELGPLQEKVFKILILSYVNKVIAKMDLIALAPEFSKLDNIQEDFDFEEEYREYRQNPNAYSQYHHDYLVLKNIIRQTKFLPNELRRIFTSVQSLHTQLSNYLVRADIPKPVVPEEPAEYPDYRDPPERPERPSVEGGRMKYYKGPIFGPDRIAIKPVRLSRDPLNEEAKKYGPFRVDAPNMEHLEVPIDSDEDF